MGNQRKLASLSRLGTSADTHRSTRPPLMMRKNSTRLWTHVTTLLTGKRSDLDTVLMILAMVSFALLIWLTAITANSLSKSSKSSGIYTGESKRSLRRRNIHAPTDIALG